MENYQIPLGLEELISSSTCFNLQLEARKKQSIA